MAKKKEGKLVLMPMPALVAVLLAREKEKGAPLTEEEVTSIRDNAASTATPLDVKLKVEAERGYLDINPKKAWLNWQSISPALLAGAAGDAGQPADFTAQSIAQYLGRSAAVMLAVAPFNTWAFESSLETGAGAPIIDYEFPQNGLALACNGEGTIETIFVHSDARGPAFPAGLSDIPWSSSRQQVIDRLGPPEKSGTPMKDPILGAYGGWTRFARPGYSIHVQYRVGADRIDMITLMRASVVP
jgi:hypothetical protein